ncbi:membrane hypothetical protein [metagenome]|uniref:APC family permease n=1 Tax=metagenome TaxID=256318 RepID=A0A2P2C1F6_9ZZZZ
MHAVVLGLAGVSPASSVFVAVVPVVVVLGGASILVLLTATLIAMLVAATYAAVCTRIPVGGGEPGWVSRLFGPRWGSAVFVLSLTTLTLVLALFLGAAVSLAPIDLPGGLALLLVGGALTLLASLTLQVAVWLSLVCLALEVAVIAMVSLEAIILAGRSGLGSALGSCVSGGVQHLSYDALVAVPVILFALNGYGQSTYLVEEVRDGGRRVRRVVFSVLALTLVLEGVPLVALGCAAADDALSPADDQLVVRLLEVTTHEAWLVESVRWAIVVALLNAILALVIFGSRLLGSFATHRVGHGATRDGRHPFARKEGSPTPPRSAGLVLGAAMVAVAVLVPDALLITATGSSLSLIYASVAFCGLRMARAGSPRLLSREALSPLLLLGILSVMTGQGLATDPVSVMTAVALLGLGACLFEAWRRLSSAG